MYDERNEFDVQKELVEKRKQIETHEDLAAFLKDVEENYNISYGCAPRAMAQASLAMAQASLAVAWYLADKFGISISSFQAGFVMWDFIRDWSYPHNKCGLKIVDYDNLLYPQYGDKFEKRITTTVWAYLQEEAKERLKNDSEYTHPAVIAHWKSIVDGNVPFGYIVVDD